MILITGTKHIWNSLTDIVGVCSYGIIGKNIATTPTNIQVLDFVYWIKSVTKGLRKELVCQLQAYIAYTYYFKNVRGFR